MYLEPERPWWRRGRAAVSKALAPKFRHVAARKRQLVPMWNACGAT